MIGKVTDREQIGDEVFEVYSKSYVDGLMAKVKSLQKANERGMQSHFKMADEKNEKIKELKEKLADYAKYEQAVDVYKKEMEGHYADCLKLITKLKHTNKNLEAQNHNLQDKLAVAEKNYSIMQNALLGLIISDYCSKGCSLDKPLCKDCLKRYTAALSTAELKAEKGEGNERQSSNS